MLARIGARLPKDLEWRMATLLPARLIDAAARVPRLRGRAARLHEAAGRTRQAAVLAARGLPGHEKLARRLAELAEALRAGRLSLPALARLPRCGAGRAVVMALAGSEPWLRSGYAIRTRCLLDALAAEGIACVPVTRPNFPQDLAAHRDAPPAAAELSHGHSYRRLRSDAPLWEGPLSAYVEAFARDLAALAQESGAGLIHAASNHVCGLAACLAAEAVGARSVYEIRGLWHRSTAARRKGWERSDAFALHEALERQAAMRADAVVVLSEALVAHVRNWGVPNERITLVPNGVDTDRFAPRARDEALRWRLGAGPDTFLVGFVGSLTPYEGLDDLVSAVAGMRADGIDAGLALVGAGEERERLAAAASRRGVPACFTGEVPFDRVPDHYAAFDACAFPRRGDAAALVPPLKLGEAMSCGVPVVVSGQPPLLELVEHERTGLVFGDGSAALAASLIRLAGDAGERARLGGAARAAIVRERTWRHAARRLAVAYGLPMPAERA